MLPKAKLKEHSVSPQTAFANLSACCKAKKPKGLWEVSTDKWPHCLGQKQICSFSYISLQPSVSTGRTETPDQWSASPASSGLSCECCLCTLFTIFLPSDFGIGKRREKRYGHSWYSFLSLLNSLCISTRMAETRNHSEQEEKHDTILSFVSS